MEDKKYELTEEELNEITGGQTTIKSLPCPVCKTPIPTTFDQIATCSTLICPGCGLKININRQESMSAIQAKKKIDEALKNSANKNNSNS